MKALSLPSWASRKESASQKVSIVIEVDSAVAYPAMLKELEADVVDQYWLEVAYQCIKLDVQATLAGTEFDPRTAGKPAEIHFSNAPEFALAKHPEGKGIAAATQGREAREHYKKLRGSLPF